MNEENPINAPSTDPAESGEAQRRRLSGILQDIADDPDRERISIGDLLAAMQDRAFGALMFIFAVPNVLPTPPGTSAVLGAPLVFLTAQLALGRSPWLPRVIADRSLGRAEFAALINRIVPWLIKGEQLLSPRASWMVLPPAEYVIGALCFLMAVILFLPIPLGNILPAFTICLFSLGILERDGVWIVAGLIATVASVVLVWGVFYAIIKSALFFLSTMLG